MPPSGHEGLLAVALAAANALTRGRRPLGLLGITVAALIGVSAVPLAARAAEAASGASAAPICPLSTPAPATTFDVADPAPWASQAPRPARAGWPAGESAAPVCAVPRAAAGGPQDQADFESEGKVIHAIHIQAENIFDPARPGEGGRLFRLANRLHRTTRPAVIERQLLFRPGDVFSAEAVRESERLLRGNTYLYDVVIHPVDAGPGSVDMEVLTRDVWTLQGTVNFHRAGGANAAQVEVEDENLLGSGKDLMLSRGSTIDRTSSVLRYRDPALVGSRGLLDVELAQNSDGRDRLIRLDRPFFSLDARWAAGITAFTGDQVDRLYDGGLVDDLFRHQRDLIEAYAGLSSGLVDGATSRFRIGFTFDRNRFGIAPQRFPGTTQVPADRTLSYPWLGYDYVEDGFITLQDLDRIQRTEDFNLGRRISLRAGWSAPAFGAGRTGRSELIWSGTFQQGWRPTTHQLILAAASTSGRDGGGQVRNGLVGGAVRYYVRFQNDSVFLAALSGQLAERLDPETQLLLGGDTGLRGYPLRYQDGDRLALLTLEQRFYRDREYLHLFHLGAAAFFDAGRAWTPGATPGATPAAALPGPLANRRLLEDIGAGLRVCSSRSSTGSVIHFDLAFPLSQGRSIRAVQWLVTTGGSF